MSIIVYTECQNGEFKKNAFEALSYAKQISNDTKQDLIAISINAKDPSILSNYGAEKIISINDPSLDQFTAQNYANIISQYSKEENVKILVMSSSADSKYIAPLIAVQLDAGLASNVISKPLTYKPLKVKRSCFTNKAYNHTQMKGEVNIICVSNNSFGITKFKSDPKIVVVQKFLKDDKIKVESIDSLSGSVSIADADVVISGGRGLKGPENWYLIENLASILGAATACSKPVSDMGWRPHSEHVGQTGKPVASNLYIAIGVSGAIQHLAGINASKIKVVINNDPEAPFFKAADYGIVGDAFDVVPRLTEKLKAFKNK
ncbi:MAG: electron transfer flavoprotein subunit alpha [Flavobacteriales bacterium]|nr:electron transfer flavoprotein subunit alpha [Flavobacteriales bacterium]|tara:strand:- start:2019 stop:2975 length:957 start_codon:yes stop_codon:yes gene_type:complete